MTETVIEDLGKWQFALVVEDGDVTARCGVPYDGTLYYSTRDRPNRADKNSQYQLDAREVVRRYVEESETDRPFGDLVDRVQAALAGTEDCGICGEPAAETFTVELEWPPDKPRSDEPVAFEDPGAASLAFCGDCASALATHVLVERAMSHELDDIYHGIDESRPEPTRHEPADFGHGESTGVQEL